MNAVRSFAATGLRAACASLVWVWLACAPAQAQVPISSNPLILNVTAAPNVLMILDNSGSMLWEALPDSFVGLWDFEYSIRAGTGNTAAYMPDYDDANILNVAMRTSQINRVYYNPAVTYRRWTGPEGTQYTASDPTNAKYTPADTSGIDLTAQQSGRFRWVTNTTATTFSFSTANVPRSASAPCTNFDQVDDRPNVIDTRNCVQNFWPMTWYVYKGAGSDLERINYYRYQIRGNDADRVDLADGSVTAVTTFNWAGGVTRTIAEEKQNFANWFTYSRSRRDAAKNGVSAAFSTLGENYRIGYRPLNHSADRWLCRYQSRNLVHQHVRVQWFEQHTAARGAGPRGGVLPDDHRGKRSVGAGRAGWPAQLPPELHHPYDGRLLQRYEHRSQQRQCFHRQCRWNGGGALCGHLLQYARRRRDVLLQERSAH
ncbi:MAG: hypothetical protein B7Z51_05400 [Methyloversatilis sp. 12-65-5]|nr:MAG: hypothetical protein B7Z51_05400 [Methyloversatilis sp. 12-65-5]